MHVVLLHGFGASGDDLVGLEEELNITGARFTFPEGPLELPGFGDGRAWWMIDLQTSPRSRGTPPGLAEARARVLELVADVPPAELILGGFSQGSMLACDVAFHLPEPPAGLIVWSGAVVAEAEWCARPGARRPRVLQSHGRFDPIIAFEEGEGLREVLRATGHEVEWIEFPGGHEIPYEAITRARELIVALGRRRPAG